MNPFDYPQETPKAQMVLDKDGRGYRQYAVRFTDAPPNRFAGENNGVRGEFYLPENADLHPL
jgi:hypothetical protein